MYVALRPVADDAPQLDVRLCAATTIFFAFALVAPWHAGVAALGFLIAVVSRRWQLPDVASPAATAFVGVTAMVAVTAFLPLLLNPLGDQGVKLLTQFCLLAAIAVLCWLVPPTPGLTAAMWAGVTAGAVLAGVAALVQVAVVGMERAVGTEGNAIVFGNLALLMGALSLALSPMASAWSVGTVSLGERHVTSATTAAVIGGTVASLLSGSRGGWLAIVPLTFLLLRGHLRMRGADAAPGTSTDARRAPLTRAVLALVIVAGVVMIARGMPVDRLGDAVDDITGYVGVEEAHGSSVSIDPAGTTIGARFEAWRSAADAAADHPILGIGWGNLQSYFSEQVITEGRHHRIAEFTHAHQQMLGALASGGILAVAAFAGLAIVPAAHFRRATRASDREQRAIGTAGLVTVVAFVVFGLTEAILENLVPVVFYAVTVGVLSSQLRVSARHERPEPSSGVAAPHDNRPTIMEF